MEKNNKEKIFLRIIKYLQKKDFKELELEFKNTYKLKMSNDAFNAMNPPSFSLQNMHLKKMKR